MRALRLTADAARDIDDLIDASEERFGPKVAGAYRGLLTRALQDLVQDPSRPGVSVREGTRPGVLFYHLRHSRNRAAAGGARIARPRHFIVFRVGPEAIEILRVLHDAMDLAARLEDGD